MKLSPQNWLNKLLNSAGSVINPATEDKQDDALVALNDILLALSATANSWGYFSSTGTNPQTWTSMETGGSYEKTWTDLET